MSSEAKIMEVKPKKKQKLKLPASSEEFFQKIAGLASFAVKFLIELFKPPYEINET